MKRCIYLNGGSIAKYLFLKQIANHRCLPSNKNITFNKKYFRFPKTQFSFFHKWVWNNNLNEKIKLKKLNK